MPVAEMPSISRDTAHPIAMLAKYSLRLSLLRFPGIQIFEG